MTNAVTINEKVNSSLTGLTGWLSRCGIAVAAIAFALPCPALLAQTKQLPNVHYFLGAKGEPGVVAGAAIARRVPGVGSYQAVEVSGPKGVQVALARDGQFLHTLEAPVKVGMIVGAVYRVRVTGIPFRPGEELYPTIEVIDRVHAPAGREHRFPVPVVLEEADLRAALDGASSPELSTSKTTNWLNRLPSSRARKLSWTLARWITHSKPLISWDAQLRFFA